MSLKRFAGQVAMTTGAASGIGQACAIRFAQEGDRVACLDFNELANQSTAVECRMLGIEATAFSCMVMS